MKKILLLAAVLLGSVASSAQDLNSGYFVKNNYYRHRLNPAFTPDSTIAGVFGAFLGNVTIAPNSDILLSSLVFPYEDRLVTGFNDAISDEQFLSGFADDNAVNLDMSYSLITIGERTKRKGFSTFELNIKSTTSASIPKSALSILKQQDFEGDALDIGKFSLSNSEYVEAVLGYSHKIGRHVTAGARIKGLVGLARADVCYNSFSCRYDYGSSSVITQADGCVKAYCPILDIGTKTLDDGQTVYDFTNFGAGRITPSGFGLAFDLGVTVTPMDGLEVSAALTDFGGIKWKTSIYGTAAEETSTKLSKSDLNKKDILFNIVNVTPGEVDGKEYIAIPHTLRLGATYDMPFYNRLSAGLVGSFKRGDGVRYNDIRLGLAVAPIRFITLSANVGTTSYGNVLGLAGNISIGAIHIYAGTDALICGINSEHIPAKAVRSVVNAGMILQFNY